MGFPSAIEWNLHPHLRPFARAAIYAYLAVDERRAFAHPSQTDMLMALGGLRAGKRRRLESAPVIRHLKTQSIFLGPNAHGGGVYTGMAGNGGECFLQDAVERNFDKQ